VQRLGASPRVVVAPLAVSIVIVLPITLLGALFVKIGPEFGLDRAVLGLLAGVFLGVSIVVAPAAGVFSERIGAASAIIAAALLAATACAGIAAVAHSGLGLVPWLVAAGLANAVGQPATAIFVVQTIPAARQGLAFGMKQATAPLGTLLAGIAVPAFALTVGWRWAFATTAVLAVIAAASVPRLRRPHVPEHASRGLRALRRRRTVLLLVLAIMLGVGAASALGVFFVDAAVTAGLSPAAAGWLQALGSSLAVGARLQAGRLADAQPSGHLRLVTVMLAGGAAGYLLLGAGGAPAIVVGTMLAFALGWGWVGVFFFAVVRLNPEAPGAATGVVQTGDFAGSLVGPIVFGSLASGGTYQIAWFVAATLAILGAGVTSTIARVAANERTLVC
jgi:predicted MFS family arabinose efflux permease